MVQEKTDYSVDKSGRKWQDSAEQVGSLFQFAKHGDEIVGQLEKIEPNVQMRNGTTTRYTIKDDDGTSWIVIGTAIINQKLGAAEVGDTVRIVYVDDTPTRNGKMKDFRVWVTS